MRTDNSIEGVTIVSITTASWMTQADRIDELIRAHKEEVSRLRIDISDPEAALSAFVREHFELAALRPSVLGADETNEFEPYCEVDLDAW